MFRPITAADEAVYLQMAHDFYQSEAVDHVIPDSYLERTFQALISGSPFSACYLFEIDGETAGYALLALTWSKEAGGLTVWVDELYVLPRFRSHGLGRSFLASLPTLYHDAVRLRLEVEDRNVRAKSLYRQLGYEMLNYQQMICDYPLKSAGNIDRMRY